MSDPGTQPAASDPTTQPRKAGLPTRDGGWKRLHPLSPVLRFSRALLGLVVVLGVNSVPRTGHSGSHITDIAVVVIALLGAVVSWLVTRWKVDGFTLRIESGLLRRDSRQVPLARIQAIDLVQPAVGRLLGLTELRLRLAGSSAHVRLAYLSHSDAQVTRDRLLALAHGVSQDAAAPPETPLVSVPTSRLAVSVALSGSGLLALVVVVATVVLALALPKALAATAGSAVVVFLALVTPPVRRVTSEADFRLADAADGLRVRCGLLQTVAETIPRGRIQAVRQVEPLLWRPLGWCRLELVVAGSTGHHGRDEPPGRVVRALMPVGPSAAAGVLLERVLPGCGAAARPAPSRARWKAPLSYHFLAGGHDDSYGLAISGRVRRQTSWVPLAKVQSLRLVQGPWQRGLGLANLHLDVPGRRQRATLRDRDASEARHLADTLPELCRAARANEALQRQVERAHRVPAAAPPLGV